MPSVAATAFRWTLSLAWLGQPFSYMRVLARNRRRLRCTVLSKTGAPGGIRSPGLLVRWGVSKKWLDIENQQLGWPALLQLFPGIAELRGDSTFIGQCPDLTAVHDRPLRGSLISSSGLNDRKRAHLDAPVPLRESMARGCRTYSK